MSENTLVTKSGIELEIQAVPEVGLQTLLFGFVNDFKIPNPAELNEIIRKHFSDTKDFSVQSQTMKLLNYITAFGIVNTPPDSAISDLNVLGMETNSPLSRKRNWLLFLVLDNEDIPELIERVIQLTYGDKINESEEKPGS